MAKLIQLFETKDGAEVRVEHMYFDEKSRIIEYARHMDGESIRLSTGIRLPLVDSEKPKEIRKAKEEANRRLKKKLTVQPGIRAFVGNLYESFLEESDKDVRRGELDPKTLQKRKQAWKQLKGFWKDKRTEEINVDSWAQYIDFFEENFKGQSLFNARKYFGFFARSLNQKIVNGKPILPHVPVFKNPFAAKERKARQKKKDRIFTDDEFKAILKACDESDQLKVLLMATMAFRIIEVCSLKWASLDLKDGFYLFGEDDNKAGHTGRQAIHSEVLSRLKKRHRSRNSDFVFPQENDVAKHVRPQMIDWKAVKLKSKVEWAWSPHTFRHWCLTQLFSNTALAQPAIMKAYRISYKVALEHYIHIDRSALETLRNAIEVKLD